MDIQGKAGHARSSSASYYPAPKPSLASAPVSQPPLPSHSPFPDDSDPNPTSLPASLNQSLWLSEDLHSQIASWRIQKQDQGVERLLWTKLVSEILTLSVPSENQAAAVSLCANLQFELKKNKSATEILVNFTEKVLNLYTKTEKNEEKEFLVTLLEKQNQEIAEIKEKQREKPDKNRSEIEIELLKSELNRIQSDQINHENALNAKLKFLEEGRKLAFREKLALQEAYNRVNQELEEVSREKKRAEEEIEGLKERMTEEVGEKIKVVEGWERTKRVVESQRVRICELEQELTTTSSPYPHLYSIGQQLGTSFATVSDLFAYLNTSLEASDPDQQYLIEAYKTLTAEMAGLEVSHFVAAMLSFLLIRKKMIEEERELQGQTLLGLKKQLESLEISLESKSKSHLQVSLEANELRLLVKTQNLDCDSLRKQTAAAEEELKVVKKAHERHIHLYKSELEMMQKKVALAEKEKEGLNGKNKELEEKLESLKEENAVLERENSLLLYEKSEFQTTKNPEKATSLRELNSTLSEIQQVLRLQQIHEKELESVISGLNLQVEYQKEALLQAQETSEMMKEELETKDLERRKITEKCVFLGSEREFLVREISELVGKLEDLDRKNEDFEVYFRTICARLEAICRRLLVPEMRFRSGSGSEFDQNSEVIKAEESVMTAGESLFVGEKRVKIEGEVWVLRGEGGNVMYWTKEGEDSDQVTHRLYLYSELEALISPYMREYEDIILTFSRILQDFEQLTRSRPVTPEPLSTSKNPAFVSLLQVLNRHLSSL